MADKDFKVKKGLAVTDNIVVGGTVDGRDLATDGAKLDLIEAGANLYEDSDVGTYLVTNGYATEAYVDSDVAVLEAAIEDAEILALMGL